MIETNELIERWENVDRVLVSLPEHERLKHFDMSTWGVINECGTIACAAGHCGLDPWFRERGFTLEFDGDEAEISSVENFFGVTGSQKIFLNTTQRSVETVLGEVRAYVGELRMLEGLTARPGIPKIGQEWAEQGGIFVGAILGVGGGPNRFLILGPEYDGYCEWDSAMAWAMDLVVGAHRDYALPTRAQHATLFDRVRNRFEKTTYWSCEQHASTSGFAWGQHFGNGVQDGWNEDGKLRARAVRSIPIE